MNQRDFHLTFCSDCLNRVFDRNERLICGLTNLKADFENECTDYQLDLKERNRIIESLENEIKDSFSTNKFIGYFNPRGTYENFEIDKYEDLPQNKKFQKRGIGFFLFLSGLSIILLILFKSEQPFYFNTTSVIVYSFLIAITLLGLYHIFNKAKYFTWTDFYINLKEDRIYFNDILFFGKSHAYTTGMSSAKFIVGTKTKGLVSLETIELDGVTPEQIGKLIKEKQDLIICNYDGA